MKKLKKKNMTDAAKRWQNLLDEHQKCCSSHVMETWFRPMQCIQFDARKIVLETRDIFFRQWVLDHYLASLQEAFMKHASPDVVVDIVINSDLEIPYVQPKREDETVSWSPSQQKEL